MSERFKRSEAGFTRAGTLSVMCICATIVLVAYLVTSNNQTPRRLWSPIVIEANGNQTVLGETRQMEFWTPSVETKNYLAKPGETMSPSDQWQVISNDDALLAFGTMLHSNKSVLGYRRVQVWGHGSTSYKPGWWWTLTAVTNYTAGDLAHTYRDFWKTQHPVFVEVIDNRGRDE